MKKLIAISLIALLLLPLSALGASGPLYNARVGDFTRLKGEGTNELVGFGLVVGLNRTGDGDGYLPTMNALASMMERFGAPVVNLDDLKGTKSVAVVDISVEIPAHGAREGDRLDVYVSAIGAAKSLEGGRLLIAPLEYHDRAISDLFGFAQGKIVADATTPTTGKIVGGARMERDVFVNVIAYGSELKLDGISHPWIQDDQTYITLVLDDSHAGYPVAATTAEAVHAALATADGADRLSVALDSKNVLVLLPEAQRSDHASWIRAVQRAHLLVESNEARVTVNRATGTIVVTGDTRLSPVVVSQRGMTITVLAPGPDGKVPRPAFDTNTFVPLDVEAERTGNVKDLLEALNRLKVPFEDRLAILEQVHRAGKLHAEIIYEG